jgi:hypothetical protein
VSREAIEDLVIGAHRANARRPPAKRRAKKGEEEEARLMPSVNHSTRIH